MTTSRQEATKSTGGISVILQIANVIGLLVTLGVNFLANALPLNGQSTGSISDQFPVLFVPAGYVFAIWGVIYLALIAFTVYQALPVGRDDPTVARIGPLFVLSCALNSVWLFLWHYELFAASIVVMLGLLATLITIFMRLDPDREGASLLRRMVVFVPFSLYLGWITVATVANATDVLYLSGWNGFGISADVWTAVMLFAALLIASFVALPRRDVAYVGVIVWAFIGIAVKQSDFMLVVVASLIAAGVIGVAAIVAFLRQPGRGVMQRA